MALVRWILNSFKTQKANLLVSHLFHASAQLTGCLLVKTSFQSHSLRHNGLDYVSEVGYQSRFTVESFNLIDNQGKGPVRGGSGPPPPPFQTWRLFENAIPTSTGFVYHFLTGWSFLMKCALHFATTKFQRSSFKTFFLWSIRLFSQSSISQIKKHVVVSVRSNLPSQKRFNSPFWTPWIKNSWICLPDKGQPLASGTARN